MEAEKFAECLLGSAYCCVFAVDEDQLVVVYYPLFLETAWYIIGILRMVVVRGVDAAWRMLVLISWWSCKVYSMLVELKNIIDDHSGN